MVTEGDSGLTPFTAALELLYNFSTPVTVKVTATPGTASTDDYVFDTTEVTLGTDGGPATVSGFIVGDIIPEGDEFFTLTATAVSPSYLGYVYSTGGLITIKDDDQARASQLHVEGVSVLEGNQGTTTAEVRVVLEPASTSTVTVSYQSKDGTALAGQDYSAVSGTLTFAPGETLKTVPIDIYGDTLPESDETFSLVLSKPVMALLGASSAEVTIANDDGPVQVGSDPSGGLAEASPDGGIVLPPDSGTSDLVPVPPKPDAWFISDTLADLGCPACSDARPLLDLVDPISLPPPGTGGSASSEGTGGATGATGTGGGSGSNSQPGAFANRSGCSCSIVSHDRPMGFVLLGLAAMFLSSARRRFRG